MTGETLAYTKCILRCGICGDEVRRCAGCKKEFYGGQPIICHDDEHFCQYCDGDEDDEIDYDEEQAYLEDFI